MKAFSTDSTLTVQFIDRDLSGFEIDLPRLRTLPGKGGQKSKGKFIARRVTRGVDLEKENGKNSQNSKENNSLVKRFLAQWPRSRLICYSPFYRRNPTGKSDNAPLFTIRGINGSQGFHHPRCRICRKSKIFAKPLLPSPKLLRL